MVFYRKISQLGKVTDSKPGQENDDFAPKQIMPISMDKNNYNNKAIYQVRACMQHDGLGYKIPLREIHPVPPYPFGI
jgi:hypothetical protein